MQHDPFYKQITRNFRIFDALISDVMRTDDSTRRISGPARERKQKKCTCTHKMLNGKIKLHEKMCKFEIAKGNINSKKK